MIGLGSDKNYINDNYFFAIGLFFISHHICEVLARSGIWIFGYLNWGSYLVCMWVYLEETQQFTISWFCTGHKKGGGGQHNWVSAGKIRRTHKSWRKSKFWPQAFLSWVSGRSKDKNQRKGAHVIRTEIIVVPRWELNIYLTSWIRPWQTLWKRFKGCSKKASKNSFLPVSTNSS